MIQRERMQIPFLWIGIGFEAGLGILALCLGWLLNEPFWNDFHWNAMDAALGLAASLPMLLVFWLCLRLPLGPLVRIRTIAEQFIRPLFAGSTWIELAGLSLVAGIGEELLFRGLFQGAMSRWWEPWVGVAVASILFGLLHAITPTYIVLAAFMGAYLGSLCLITDNLLTVIVAHASYDFVALIYLMGSAPTLNDDDEFRTSSNESEE
jgi:membrane protease YdiL (CAAX protease family)